MAKSPMVIIPPSKKSAPATTVTAAAAPVVIPAASEATLAVDELLPPVKQPVLEVVSAKKDKDGWVRIVMLETIDPPPKVGRFDVADLLNVARLSAKAVYLLPPQVAEVLIDRKKASAVQEG